MPPKKATSPSPKKTPMKSPGKEKEVPMEKGTPSKEMSLTQEEALVKQSLYKDYYEQYWCLDQLVRGPSTDKDMDISLGAFLKTWTSVEDALVPFDQITIRGKYFFKIACASARDFHRSIFLTFF